MNQNVFLLVLQRVTKIILQKDLRGYTTATYRHRSAFHVIYVEDIEQWIKYLRISTPLDSGNFIKTNEPCCYKNPEGDKCAPYADEMRLTTFVWIQIVTLGPLTDQRLSQKWSSQQGSLHADSTPVVVQMHTLESRRLDKPQWIGMSGFFVVCTFEIWISRE